MMMGADFGPVNKLAKKILGFSGKFEKNMTQFQDGMDQKLLEKVIQHASGRPGPNVVTGQYVAAFKLIDHKVVNLSPQAARLEYGFVGKDSLDRDYHQPPFPHFRPALEEMRKEYKGGIVLVFKQTWREG